MVDENTTQPSKAEDKEERFVRIRRRYRMCVDAIADQRQKWVDDFEFAWVDGKQWDSHFGKMRGSRPKYEFNKLRQAIKQVVNDNRQNTPSIKVRATEEGDRGLAEVRQGLIRNIESESKADEAYDWGGLYAITSGFGCWRVTTEWVDDDAFDQDIRIRRIHNPWSVWFDPAAKEFDRSDARFAFVDDTITREEFVERWPEKDCVNFENTAGFGDWFGKDAVRIAEYWEKTEVDREMVQLSDGSVVDAKEWSPPEVIDPMAPPPVTEVSRRKVRSVKLTVEILSGKETLEGPFEWLDNQIPLVPVWGDIVTVEGRDIISGMVRPARDAQVLYNFERSNFAEVIAKQPSAPFLYTPKQIQGFEKEWEGLATDDAPGLPYNPDPAAPGVAPSRQQPPVMSPGYMAALQLSSDDLKAVTGIYDASLGARSNETSGRAIMARKQEGDVANYDYADNIARAIRRTGELVNRLIPKVYSNERQIRILGEDGAEKYVQINHLELDPMKNQWQSVTGNYVGADGKTYEAYDITQGKYDVTISTGPSYTTQRMEALDAFMQLAQGQGPLAELAKYGMLKSMDAPGMDETLEAMRRQLVLAGLLPPGEEDQPPPPPPPNPKDVADAERSAAQAAKYGAEAEWQGLQNQQAAMQLGYEQGLMGAPPGWGEPMPPMEQQPPHGGFFMPGAGNA